MAALPGYSTIFFFVLVVGLLLFWTSKLALDHHMFKETILNSIGQSLSQGRHAQLLAARHQAKGDSKNGGGSVRGGGFSSVSTTTEGSAKTGVGGDGASTKSSAPSPPNDGKCRLSFPPNCTISRNLIRYYEEHSDTCLVSPLKKTGGLLGAKTVADRKYVVFQPDLGGWNNIRMALEVVILFAHITGRILVMPPHAVLYLLVMNKKWDNNFSAMDDFIDFSRMKAGDGLEVVEMEEFLSTVAAPGLLSLPLPDNNTKLRKQPLWDYLERACYVRQWSPGKTYFGFNISAGPTPDAPPVFGTFDNVDKDRLNRISIDRSRQLIPYDKVFHDHRAVFFPGHDDNRLLTHWYGFFFFAELSMARMVKRYMRDRVRYLDVIFCVSGRVIDRIREDIATLRGKETLNISPAEGNTHRTAPANPAVGHPLVSYAGDPTHRVYRFLPLYDSYIAYHIRRGDFQQTHTRLPAEDILRITLPLIPGNTSRWLVYIATDERDISFFEPFFKAFGSVKFLSDYTTSAGLTELDQNHIGMVEQVVCSNAHTFIGTPLSTFTGFIMRMRGYMNRTTVAEAEPDHPERVKYVVSHSKEEEEAWHAAQSLRYKKETEKKRAELAAKEAEAKAEEVEAEGEVDGSTKKKKKKKKKKKEAPKEPTVVVSYQKSPHPPPLLGQPVLTVDADKEALVGRMSNSEAETSTTGRTPRGLAEGLYERTFHFLGRFTYILQEKPNLELPFWTREFAEPILDTEDLE